MRQDETDDLAAPPPLPVFRMCGAKGCRRHARDGGRHCSVCHAAAVQRWRNRGRAAINAHRLANLSDEQRARNSASATLAMALKRGKIARGPCTVCGLEPMGSSVATVTAYQADPRRPLDVVWVCRRHREALVDRLEHEQRRVAEQDAWRLRVERCDRELPLLPLDMQTAIQEAASRGPAGRLDRSAPLYRINLVRLFERTLESR